MRHITDTYTLYIKANGQILDALPIHWDAARQRFDIPNVDRLALGFVDQTQADPLYDVAAPEQWESGVAWNPSTVMSQNSIAGLHPGSPISGGGQFSIDNDSSTFRRIDIAMLQGGNVTIAGIKYFNESGVHTLPPAYYQIMSNKTVIIKPNAPTHIILQTSGSGQYYLEQRSEPSAYGLAPSDTMSMTIQTLQIRTSGNEGWGVYPTNLTTKNARGTAGSTVNMLFGVINQGLVGGDITAQIKVGDGSASDQVLKSFGSRHFNPQEYDSLAAEVTLPTNHAFLYLEVTLPDGRTFRQGRFVQEPRAKTPEPRALPELPAGIPADMRTELEKHAVYSAENWNARVVVIAHQNDPDHGRSALIAFAKAWNQLSGGDPIVIAQAKTQLAQMGVTGEDAKDGETGTDIGGSSEAIWNPAVLHSFLENQAAWNSLFSLINIQHDVPGALGNLAPDVDSVLGYMFAGVLQDAAINRSTSHLSTLADQLSTITGIGARRLLLALQKTDNAERASTLAGVFSSHGLQGLLISEHIDDPSTRALPLSLRVAPGVDGDENQLMVRFNFLMGANPSLAYDHANIYLADAAGNRIGNALTLTLRNQLFAAVPVSALSLRLGAGEKTFKIILQVLPHDGTPYFAKASGPITLRLPEANNVLRGNYSTNPDADLQKQENEVLAILAANKPYRAAGETWSVMVASGKHDTEAFHALDIGAGSADIGKEVLAVAAGKITTIDLSFGTVIIDHAAQGSVVPAWQSKFLHMPLVLTNEISPNGNPVYISRLSAEPNAPVIRIWLGKEVEAGDSIGLIAGRGVLTADQIASGHASDGVDEDGKLISDTAFDEHIHLESLLNGRAINMTGMVQTAWQISIGGDDSLGGKAGLHWSSAVDIGNQGGALVNEALKLIFFRDPSITDDAQNDLWLAWQEGVSVSQMQRVQLQKVDEIYINGQKQDVFRWVRAGSAIWTAGNNIWNPESQSWTNYVE